MFTDRTAGTIRRMIPVLVSGERDPSRPVLFSGQTRAYGVEPWGTDGTPQGTHMLADLNSVCAASDPHELVPFAGALHFAATEADVASIPDLAGRAGGIVVFPLWPMAGRFKR